MPDQKEMERILNLTYPGLQLMLRDANLRSLDAKYKQGLLLREADFTQGSVLCAGLTGTHRYAILSNRLRLRPESAQNGLRVIDRNAYFKVLDIYKRLGKTQITLLHLPDAHWWLFEDLETNVDDLLVDYTRKRFDAVIDAAPAPQLDTPQWRKACNHLIGMTDLGVLTPLN